MIQRSHGKRLSLLLILSLLWVTSRVPNEILGIRHNVRIPSPTYEAACKISWRVGALHKQPCHRLLRGRGNDVKTSPLFWAPPGGCRLPPLELSTLQRQGLRRWIVQPFFGTCGDCAVSSLNRRARGAVLGSQTDFDVVVFARPGAGGEFLMSLLKSHNSTLWDGFKFHCFQHIYTGPEEQPSLKLHIITLKFINDIPLVLQQFFDILLILREGSTTVPNIFLKFDFELLKRFRQYRIKRHRLAHMFASSCEQFDKLFDESLFISDSNTTSIVYFSPLILTMRYVID